MRATLVLLLALPFARAAEQGAMAKKNPIRKVVTMLQDIKQKVITEGEEEEKPPSRPYHDPL